MAFCAAEEQWTFYLWGTHEVSTGWSRGLVGQEFSHDSMRRELFGGPDMKSNSSRLVLGARMLNTEILGYEHYMK